MSWYLTIRPDPGYSRTADPTAIFEFLRSMPELVPTGVNSFGNAPGQPWVSLTLASSDRGSYSNQGLTLASVNLIDMVCSYGHDEGWYDALAARIAAFLDWEALDEHAGRTVRTSRTSGT